jgi:hypothetical protein
MPDATWKTVFVGDREVTVSPDALVMYLKWANGNKLAADVIRHVGAACQVADDLVDERDIKDPSGKMVELVVLLAGALQTNKFYDENRKMLEPVIMTTLLSWDLANALVAGPGHGTLGDRRYAFAYRELIEQIVGIIALLTGGIAHARQSLLESHAWHHVLNGESFEDYEKELLAS